MVAHHERDKPSHYHTRTRLRASFVYGTGDPCGRHVRGHHACGHHACARHACGCHAPLHLQPYKYMGIVIAALCLILFSTYSASANTVQINDAAHVLNVAQVKPEAANLPDPIAIYTTNAFAGSASAFDQLARSHITNPVLIVIAIDTVHHHLAIVGGASVPLSDAQYSQAVNAFVTTYTSSHGNYTGATIAAIRSLRSNLGAAPVAPGNNNQPGSGNNSSSPASGGLLTSAPLTLCCLGLLILAIGGVIIFGLVRRHYSSPGGG